MPAPATATYSAAALVAAHTSFKALIDAGGVAGSIKVRSATDVLLAQVPLVYPCGTVNGSTGQLAFTIAGPNIGTAVAGTAAYGELCDSAGLVHLALPVQVGSAAVSGYLVMNTLTVVAAGSVTVTSATVG